MSLSANGLFIYYESNSKTGAAKQKQNDKKYSLVLLTLFALSSRESFHADTRISIFLVQGNAFASVLTGRTVTRRL